MLIPLLDDMDVSERIAAGRRMFSDAVQERTPADTLADMLAGRNWVTLYLALSLADQLGISPSPQHVDALIDHPHLHVSVSARRIARQTAGAGSEKEIPMEPIPPIALTDKILHLKNIEIFADLSVNELAAIAAVTEEAAFDADEQVFREGDVGDTLYLVLDGNVAVIKDCNREKEIELDTIGAGDYFGEMALFGDDRRSATIRVKHAARFLTLHKQELQEIVREYPQIALHVCRVLSMRIRGLHGKISDQSC
jgi:hypothetical protein